MNITLEHTGNLTADITLHLEPEDFKDQVTSKLKEQGKRINLPGFRPGKIPIGVVRKMIGKSVMIEELNQIVSKEIHEYITSENLDVLGDPMPKSQKSEDDFDPACQDPMDFVFEVGLAPEFEVNLDLPNLPVAYEITIDEDTLDKEVEFYRERFGEVESPEKVEKGDIIYGKLFEVDENGEAIEEGFEQMIPLNPRRIENDAFLDVFNGAELESIHDIDLLSLSEETQELQDMFFVDEGVIESLQGKKTKFEIKRLNRTTLADLNEDLFKKAAETLKWDLGEEETLDEATFREKLGEELQKTFQENSHIHYRNEMTEAMIDGHKLEFPDEFLKKWIQASREGYDEARVEAEYPDFTKSLIWTLIEGKLIEKFEIKVEEHEIDEQLKENIRRNVTMQMGQEPDEALIEAYLQHAKQDQNTMQQTFRSALNKKVLDAVKEEIKPTTESISANDFKDLLEQKK